MAEGKKDLAYFMCDALPEEFDHCIATQKLETMRFRQSVGPVGVIAYRSGNSRRARRLAYLIQQNKCLSTPGYDWESVEREIGELLGYSLKDVDAWISRIRPGSSNQPKSGI
jgi:hypothetical protein